MTSIAVCRPCSSPSGGAALPGAQAILQADAAKPFLEWENTTEWVLLEGVWVPAHHESRSFQVPSPKPVLARTLDFRWESINAPVDPELFTYKTFDLPEHVGVQDLSGGQVVWVKPLPRVAAEAVHTVPSRRMLWGVAIGSAPVVALLVWVLMRRHRRANRGA